MYFDWDLSLIITVFRYFRMALSPLLGWILVALGANGIGMLSTLIRM